MIKNIRRYLKESEKQRELFLRNLNYKESAKILEGLLSSRLLLKMHFSKDDNPISLCKQSELKKRNI